MKCKDNHLFISIHWEIKRIELRKKSAHEVISGSNNSPSYVDMQENFELDSFFHTKPVQVFH